MYDKPLTEEWERGLQELEDQIEDYLAPPSTKNKEVIIEAESIYGQWVQTFDAVPDMMAILDTEYRILEVNKALAERLSIAPDEARGRPCYEVVHGTSEPPPYCPYTKLLEDGKEHTAEVNEERLCGDFWTHVSPLDAAGRLIGAVLVARDITERRRDDDLLRENETRFRELFNNMGSGVWRTCSGP